MGRRNRKPHRFAVPLALAGLLAVHLTLWASAALAATPSNDDFANREVLSGTLPIEAPGSNEGATKEAGESLESYAAAGHSVWFEWQAPGTEWVTIGSCTGTLYPVVGIFEGTSLGSLVKVARTGVVDHSQAGQNCGWFEREYTFWATAGTTYVIAVDGSTNPSIQPPATEGTFTLHVESTPTPPNDDFEDATPLQGEFFAEGSDRFYLAEASGYTWRASKQVGEPNHGGDPGGASVWYAWVAPESGLASVGKCCDFFTSVYVGDAVDGLTVVSQDGSRTFPVTAGTTYRIAVDGRFHPWDSSVWMGSFFFSVSMYLPSLTPTSSLTPGTLAGTTDTTPPRTMIVKHYLKAASASATFAFRSSESGSSFRCKLDTRPFTPCGSPKTYKHLRSGKHTFEVKARDAAGNRDSTPAAVTFRLARPASR